MNTLLERANAHAQALAHQLVEAWTEYAAEAELDGEKLAKLLTDAGITHFGGGVGDPDNTAINDESCDFMLEHPDQLGLADTLVLLEAIGCEVHVTCVLPVESRKKLYTPGKQARLAVTDHLSAEQARLGKQGRS